VIELAYPSDSSEIFSRLNHLPGAIFFDSSQRQDSRDIIAALPEVSLRVFDDGNELTEANKPTKRSQQCAFEQLKQLQQRYPHCWQLGFVSYDYSKRLHDIERSNLSDLNLPYLQVNLYPIVVVIDHQQQRCWLECQQESDYRQQIDTMISAINTPKKPEHFSLVSDFLPNQGKVNYQKRFRQIQQYLQQGDCYQINFAERFSAKMTGSAYAAYQQLRAANPAPFAAFYQTDDYAILCLSPERFLRVSDGRVETQPIKGTVARGKNAEQDEANKAWLLSSEKDRAENVMIVDLLRNDISQHCQVGSVKVNKLAQLETFAAVHHLVSSIEGTLEADSHPLDLLKACFPGGSITGAPKRRAMQLIEQLEPVNRSIYCGSFFYLDPSNNLDSNIAIRTLIQQQNTLHCYAGGGIVIDSNCQQEQQECLDKVNLLLNALRQTL